jgi:hypothetical protein
MKIIHLIIICIKLNRKFTIDNMTFNLKILLIKTFSNYYFLGLRVTP